MTDTVTVVAEYEDEFIKCPYGCHPVLFACEEDVKFHLWRFGVDKLEHMQRWKDLRKYRK